MTRTQTATSRRVLFVINSLARGGAETQLLGVVRAAVAEGYDVRVATLLPENDFAEDLEALGVPVWAPPPGSSWSARHLVRLARLVLAWRPATTVAFLFQATLFMRALNLLLRPEVAISSVRNERLESRLRGWLFYVTGGVDDHVVVNSQAARTALQRSRTVPRGDKVKVIYNGVEPEAIRARVRRSAAQVRAELGVAPDDVLFLGVGRLSAQKNWQVWIQALSQLPTAQVQCVVAGTGELAAALQSSIASHDLTERFQLLGLRPDVPDLVAAADCLVLSSDYEGTPNVVLEAMALGTPVIATDVGACRELLGDGYGVVVPAGDPQALAHAMAQFSRGRGPHAASIPRDALAAFTWANVTQAWLSLLSPLPHQEGVIA